MLLCTNAAVYSQADDYNTNRGIPWFEKAGTKGSTFACYSLGCLYMDLKKYKLARTWFEKAANRGDEAAQSYLKFMDKSNYY